MGSEKLHEKVVILREFPGGPVVRIRHLHCGGLGSIPGQGTEILQAARCSQKERKKVIILMKSKRMNKSWEKLGRGEEGAPG